MWSFYCEGAQAAVCIECSVLPIKEVTQLKHTCSHSRQLNLFWCIMQSHVGHVSQLGDGRGCLTSEPIVILHADMFFLCFFFTSQPDETRNRWKIKLHILPAFKPSAEPASVLTLFVQSGPTGTGMEVNWLKWSLFKLQAENIELQNMMCKLFILCCYNTRTLLKITRDFCTLHHLHYHPQHHHFIAIFIRVTFFWKLGI